MVEKGWEDSSPTLNSKNFLIIWQRATFTLLYHDNGNDGGAMYERYIY